MHPYRKRLAKNPVFKTLSSVKITVACLGLLFILTFWGTIDQVQNGLYLSQARFFNSWAFTFWGFVPFPGARLVLWVMFINLSSVAAIRLVYRWDKLGITVIHAGLMLFFVAAFVTFHSVEEANITLMEGEATNTASAYHNWELAVWTQEDGRNQVVAFDSDHLQKGDKLSFERYGMTANVLAYYRNCEAYGAEGEHDHDTVLNDSGIKTLKPVGLSKEPEKNIPGVIIKLEGTDQGTQNILLFGREADPYQFIKDGRTHYVKLRLKRFEIPFIIRLKDFTMERHPNTDIARSYESLVEVISRKVPREVLISMNEPLRHKDYTMYQASYSVDQMGREHSTLAVVRNQGRWLPYIATFITFAGLLIHCFLMAFPIKSKRRRAAK